MTEHQKFFKNPPYTWPNPAFPFRIYVDTPKLRVFLIENISHNWRWLYEWRNQIRDTDVFFVMSGSHQSQYMLKNAILTLELTGISKSHFVVLANDDREFNAFTALGFTSIVINNNAWLDEKLVMQVQPDTPKIFDAIYVGRKVAIKRHMLAAKVPNLALVAGPSYRATNQVETPDTVIYTNTDPLTPAEVCTKINQSLCGLILSPAEGACFASSEYLLCGVPVVSTLSEGGRDVWYDTDNSIIVEPHEDAVRDAVAQWGKRKVDPATIRQNHINLATVFRNRFVTLLSETLDHFGETSIDPQDYFNKNFFHKMRKSFQPDFAQIFG